MSGWRPEPGRLLAVVPTAASTEAAGGAPVHAGEPSMLQEDHLRAYAGLVARGGEHRAWTGVATELDGVLDRAALASALTRIVNAHEGLRTWFDVSGADPVRHLVPAPAVDFEVVETAPLDDEDWLAALHAHMNDLFSAQCRPDSWPGFALGVVERADSFGLFWGCDHAFTDGASQIMLASELAALYDEGVGAASSEQDAARPVPGSFLSYAAEERAAETAFHAESPEVRGWVDVVARNGGTLPTFPLDLGLAPGEVAPVRIVELELLDAGQLSAFDRVCKAAGTRLSSGVFAALAQTERLVADRDSYFGVTVLSTRGSGDYAQAQGWFCAFAPVAFEVAECGSFAELALSAHQGFERAKSLSVAPVHTVLETLVSSGTTKPEALGSPQLVSYIDLRWFPGVGTVAHDRGLHFTGEGRTANASMWINRDAERLYLIAQTPDTAQAQAVVADYQSVLKDVMVAAADGRLLQGEHARHDG